MVWVVSSWKTPLAYTSRPFFAARPAVAPKALFTSVVLPAMAHGAGAPSLNLRHASLNVHTTDTPTTALNTHPPLIRVLLSGFVTMPSMS